MEFIILLVVICIFTAACAGKKNGRGRSKENEKILEKVDKINFKDVTLLRDVFSVVEGYDLALAQVNYCRGKSIVINDYHLDGIERFFVITGPNKGGKTTFARSIGQLVVFSLLGLYVPAIL